MRSRLLPLLAVAVLSTACIEALQPDRNRYGAISVPTYEEGPDYVTRPNAAFYQGQNVIYVPFVGDTCIISIYRSSTVISGNIRTLDGGNYLETHVSNRTDSLTPSTEVPFIYYVPLNPSGIPFTPGDTMTVTIPGTPSGFPAATIRVRTAEAFTHDAVEIPAPNTALPVTWTAAPQPGSQMTFSLRYATPTSGGELVEQIFCSFVDDGSGTISAGFLDGWRLATGDVRETRAVRVRSAQLTVDPRTYLSLVSIFSQPLNAPTP